MSDLPVEQKEEKKEIPLTPEQRLEKAEKDIQEIARGVNTQAALLEGIISSYDSVIKTYLALTAAPKAAEKKDA